MKKLIVALVAVAAVFAGGMETSFAQSKKKAPSSITAFLGGVSLRKATPAQLLRAFNRALARNPGNAEGFLSQLLDTGKISGSSLISLAGQAASANPAMAVSIFNAVASNLSGNTAALKSLAQTIVAASPGSKTVIASALASNTGGKVNSNEI
jgi:hypothetical protein